MFRKLVVCVVPLAAVAAAALTFSAPAAAVQANKVAIQKGAQKKPGSSVTKLPQLTRPLIRTVRPVRPIQTVRTIRPIETRPIWRPVAQPTWAPDRVLPNRVLPDRPFPVSVRPVGDQGPVVRKPVFE
jgi:hypothetical protein